MGAGIADGVARRLALVAAEIVEDDDIAGIEGWCQALLDQGGEGNAADRAISGVHCASNMPGPFWRISRAG
ncbi:hypothetical protein T190_11515 [Sinorhizobium meliloti CCBAU 01290]|nr:hypothetical protein T190_11515 [Sinorhizobium meliloti CCBAU 01290]